VGDFGVDAFDAFELMFKLNFNAFATNGVDFIICALTNAVSDPEYQESVYIRIVYLSASSTYRLSVNACDGATIYDNANVILPGIDWYCKLTHAAGSNTLKLQIFRYEDMVSPSCTITLSVATISTPKRYLFPFYNKDNANAATISGTISNMIVNGRTISPTIQIKPDGETLNITWLGSHIVQYPQIYSRDIYNNVLSATETLTDWGSATYYIAYITMDIDSNGYRHICCILQQLTTTNFNIYYLYENGLGWQPAVLLNSEIDEINKAHYISNVLINPNNEVYIAYDVGPFDSTSKTPLYLRKIVNGVIGDRVLVQAGNPDVGGTIPHMQFDKNWDINIIYMSNTSPDTYNTRKILKSGIIGNRNVLHTVDAGRDLSYLHTPINISPTISNIRPNVAQQNLFYLYADYATGVPGAIDLKLGYSSDCVMGAPAESPRVKISNYNIRGAISRTKFNNMSNVAII
jgi:hypothetical protein